MKNYGTINKNLEIKTNIENLGYSVENTINVSLKVNGIPVNWTGPVEQYSPLKANN